MNLKNVTIGAFAAVALILGGHSFAKQPVNVTVQAPAAEAPVVGSVSSADIYSPYLNVNGVYKWFRSVKPTAATTTVCALRSPLNATSTLVRAVADFLQSSTTATALTWAKASTAYATTTILATTTTAANSSITFPAATTTAYLSDAQMRQSLSDLTFAPGQYVVLGMSGGVGTFSPTGGCNAEWAQTTYQY